MKCEMVLLTYIFSEDILDGVKCDDTWPEGVTSNPSPSQIPDHVLAAIYYGTWILRLHFHLW